MRPETNPQIAAEFWAEQRRIRLRREEIMRMPNYLERLEAITRDVWTQQTINGLFSIREVVLFCNPANELDLWLAEDGRVPEVKEALGL